MEVEGIRLIADWLKDATNGVNALRAGVPRYAGHAEPPAVTVYDEIDRTEVARGPHVTQDTGLSLPALLVYEFPQGIVADVEGQVQTLEQDATMEVAIAYVARVSDTALLRRNAGYTLRAVRRSLVRANRAVTMPNANGIELVQVQRVRRARLAGDPTSAEAWMALVATLELRDNMTTG